MNQKNKEFLSVVSKLTDELKRKEKFVDELSNVISNSKDNTFKELKYESSIHFSSNGYPYTTEIVKIICENNCTYSIDVTGDSTLAIMLDVSKEMLKH